MKTSEIICAIEKFAPVGVSREFVCKANGYDNSGLIIGGEEISHDKILVCMDIEKKDIDFAIENGIKFIFSHHPYIYGKIADIAITTPKGREIISLLKNEITVYSAHLNLDGVENGIDDTLASLLGGIKRETFLKLDGGGYGKISVLPEKKDSGEFCENLHNLFGVSKSVISRGSVEKIASFCGSGLEESGFYWGIEKGADTFVSSDIKHHMMVEASRYGVNIFDVPHGYSEFVAMKECVNNIHFAGLEVFFQSGKVGVK